MDTTIITCKMQKSPFVRRESGYREQYDANTDIAEDDAHPYFLGKRVEEAENSWLLFDGLLDHDGDTKRHEWLAEVDDTLPLGCYCHGCNRYVGFLKTEMDTNLSHTFPKGVYYDL